ncbi:MAG: sulfite exporter TauE/SafE family protein [Actinomycetota bacterium]|nr:sulfite exporter TauE/SafE family protein [Actinomycetota bacterium]
MPSRRLLTLAAIGTAAGLYSGLFGVGGGGVMVPLLVLWMGYDERRATGTSLAAIVIIASFAAVTQGAYGNLHVREGLLIGIPAVGGVLAGTWLQQRVPNRAVSLLFVVVLIAVAADLLFG